MLSAIDISRVIGDRPLLRSVDLSCERGQAVCVVGPNGAGKTLLLQALALVDPPTSGRVTIDDQCFVFGSDVANPPAPWPTLSYVFQHLFLWPHLTLADNLMLPPRCRGLPEQEIRTQADRLADRLGIAEILDRFPVQVSGGQRQRAALARALMGNPKWLLLDEPNSALDVEQNQILRDLLIELKREGVGVLFSTHLLGFAASVADKVIFIEGGVKIEEGPASILRTPQSERLKRFVSFLEASAAIS